MHTPDPTIWRKSSYSGQNGSCVEIALTDSIVGVRDSKNTGAGRLTLVASHWNAFVAAVKADRLTV